MSLRDLCIIVLRAFEHWLQVELDLMEPKIRGDIYNRVGFIINLNLFIVTRLTWFTCAVSTPLGASYKYVYLHGSARISPLISTTQFSVMRSVVLAPDPEKKIPGKGNDRTGFLTCAEMFCVQVRGVSKKKEWMIMKQTRFQTHSLPWHAF